MILEIRAHLTCHVRAAVFDFVVAPHLWDITHESKVAAVFHDDFKAIKYLISIGADIHKDDDFLIKYAASFGRLEIVKYLLSIDDNPSFLKEIGIRRAITNSKVIYWLPPANN